MASPVNRDYSFYKRLRQLLKRPTVRSRMPAEKQSSRFERRIFNVFQRAASNAYQQSLAGSTERLARTRDYELMDLNCIGRDTKIALFGKEEFLTIEELSKKYKNGEKFLIYAYDHKKNKLVPAYAHHPRQTKVDKTYKIIFDDDSYLIATGDHPIMMRDGTYKTVLELKQDDSLMPYKKELEVIELLKTQTSLNHKVKSIEYYGLEPVFDLTVDGYENFATDTVVVHNSSLVCTALHVYADDSTTIDENGKVLSIVTNNQKIKSELHELFYDRLNIDFNIWHWVRNTCKYGDFFLLLDVLENQGITSLMPLPTVEIEREEGYDGDINSVRFRWNAASAAIFDNYQIAHFRMMGDDSFLPYGKSILEAGRRTWKQLNLIEDAMLVYRIQRAPERRIFKIDVGNLPPDDVPGFMQKAKDILKRQPMVDTMGNVDLRFNVAPIHKDTIIPLLDGRNITIENLAKEYDSGKINWVYSVQDNTHQIVPGKVKWCGKNYTAIKLIKITLDDNTIIKTAPEHPFILRDGTYIRADELQESDSLMPFYREISNKKMGDWIDGYEKIYNPCSLTYEYTHKLINRDFGFNNFENFKISVLQNTYSENLNHKVKHIEILEETVDVYCMTVVGFDNENDRHNFAVCTDEKNLSGIFIKNTTEEDFFIPTRGKDSGADITSLPGGTSLNDIEDVRYIQQNLISALAIPRAYLGHEDMLNSKSNLSQEDVRFSRTIQRIQKLMISELNKIAMIHLYALGYDNPDDLTGFKLQLTNPSTVNEMQKLELYKSRFEIYTSAMASVGVDRKWAQKHILELDEKKIDDIGLGIKKDAKLQGELQGIQQLSLQTTAPQQQQGQGGGGAPPIPGQPDLSAVPGGESPNVGTTTSSFGNDPKNPMSISDPTDTKKTGKVKTEEEEEPKVSDLFDKNDKDDREIIDIAKKHGSRDWLDNKIREHNKVTREMKTIFSKMNSKLKNITENTKHGKKENTTQ